MTENGREYPKVIRLSDSGDRRSVAQMTPGERMDAAWQVTLDARAFMGRSDEADRPTQRDMVSVFRRQR